MQFKAGYFIHSIFDLFLNQAVKEKVEKIVDQLCHFELETKDELSHQKTDYSSEIKVISNIFSRGVPGLPSNYIEDLLASTLGKNQRVISKQNHISYPFKDDSITEEIYRALHIIDPRLNKENQSVGLEKEWKKKGAGFHLDFKFSLIPEYLGQEYLQLIEENRNYGSLTKSSYYDGSFTELEKKFEQILNKKNDFVLEMPYSYQDSRGMTIELDDSPTETKYDYEIDQLKQAYCKNLGLSSPLVIDTQKFNENNQQLKPLINFTYNEYFDTISKNYRSPLYNSTEGMVALQYALSPLAVARIERTVIEYLLSGKLSLKDKSWEVAVIERDVPCAHLAFQDLKLHFDNLFALEGIDRKFPEIKLTIYRSAEFKNAKLNVIYPGNIKSIDNFDKQAEYDLLLDISVIQRAGVINEVYATKAKLSAVIRSVRSTNASTNILTDKALQYVDIFSQKKDEKVKDKALSSLKYFLKNIFRKEVFLPGQLELINNALQKHNTLGKLPSGGGKTIAYQMASILQPGVNIVVTPLMSVMADQVFGLEKSRIESVVKINHAIKNQEKFATQLNLLGTGNCLFAFISADYFRVREIRNVFYAMEQDGVYINHLIVDEAHCVSEWGHDFRPSYAGLGVLKEQLLKNKTKQDISVIALSATAAYACLSDIKKEFRIEDNFVVETIENQAKLNFKIIDTTSNQIKSDMDFAQIENLVGGRKQVHFSFLVKELFPDNRDSAKRQDTVIFCPNAYGKTGVSDKFGDGLADKLKSNFEKVKIGAFWGTSDDGTDNVPLYDAYKSEKNYIKFVNNQLDILIATRSFGIGISKPDIRNIIFFSPPSSVESFIQQCYRTGRDGESTNCSLIVDKQEFTVPENDPLAGYLPNSKTNFDKYLAYTEIIKKYKGKDKELAIINELLSSIHNPVTTYLDIITHEVQNEFQLDLELVLQPTQKPNRLYLNQESKSYGYVDLSDLQINTESSEFEAKTSKALLEYVAEEVKKRTVLEKNYANLLGKEIYSTDNEGILGALDKLKTGGIKELIIPFENDAIDRISELLTKKVSESFDKKTIKHIYLATNSLNGFVEKINQIKSIAKEKKLIQELSQLHTEVRLKFDTKLAIYRLYKLGLIEDSLIDELNHQFVIKLRKKGSEAGTLKLHDLYDEYLLQEKAVELKMLLSKSEGDEIKKAINAYIEFCYDFIVQERFNSVETLHRIIAQIPENKTNSQEINQHIKQFFDNYFKARFSSLYFSILQGASPLNGNSQDYGIIKNYLNQMGSLKENWLQLKNSTKTLTTKIPDNYIPYLLDAYTSLVNGEQNDELVDAAFDQIARGFIKMRQKPGYQLENYENDIQLFLEYLYQNRPDLKESYGPILWLRLHYIWLKDFNKGLKEEALA